MIFYYFCNKSTLCLCKSSKKKQEIKEFDKKKDIMPTKKLRFVIYGNVYQTKKSMAIQKILSYLSTKGAEIVIEEDFYKFITQQQHISVDNATVLTSDDYKSDFVISMGGDGTFLKAAARVGGKNIPIIGVNMGRLGFLADVSPSDIEQSIDSIYSGEYQIEKRAVINIEAEGINEYPYALNDISILKRDNASMISIRTEVNGEYLTTYQADGLVISTPTGSTAYNLSNGGPILVPNSDIIVMTPVAPHSINIRPIVLPNNSTIKLSVSSRNHNFLVAMDGRSFKCQEGTTITLRKAPYDILVVKRSGTSYFHTLREKLMWGADIRN